LEELERQRIEAELREISQKSKQPRETENEGPAFIAPKPIAKKKGPQIHSKQAKAVHYILFSSHWYDESRVFTTEKYMNGRTTFTFDLQNPKHEVPLVATKGKEDVMTTKEYVFDAVQPDVLQLISSTLADIRSGKSKKKDPQQSLLKTSLPNTSSIVNNTPFVKPNTTPSSTTTSAALKDDDEEYMKFIKLTPKKQYLCRRRRLRRFGSGSTSFTTKKRRRKIWKLFFYFNTR
jgi:hypothetical protein